VIVLCAHSMPSVGRIPGRPLPVPRADVVIGSQGRTTAAPQLLLEVARVASAFGWTTAHDDPYAGGATTIRLGQPEHGQHAIQLELARRLYLDETTLRRLPQGMAIVRSFCRTLVAKLGATAVG
ncbi:MAG: N-formylglutamate amidohydrolase, partial [Polyangiaceae bacterium]|nr:N-formylglutamate amidohydrolase [Polyangiaceae bacterium]